MRLVLDDVRVGLLSLMHEGSGIYRPRTEQAKDCNGTIYTQSATPTIFCPLGNRLCPAVGGAPSGVCWGCWRPRRKLLMK